jgi:hypothetical protein
VIAYRVKMLQERFKAVDSDIKCRVERGKKVIIGPEIGGRNVDDENGEVAIRCVW